MKSSLELRMLPFRPSNLPFSSGLPGQCSSSLLVPECLLKWEFFWTCDTKMHYKHTTLTSCILEHNLYFPSILEPATFMKDYQTFMHFGTCDIHALLKHRTFCLRAYSCSHARCCCHQFLITCSILQKLKVGTALE